MKEQISGHNPTISINNHNILKYIDQAAEHIRTFISAALKNRMIMLKYDLITKFRRSILGLILLVIIINSTLFNIM